MQPPVLAMPDFGRKFVLQTDASSLAIAAVLSQEVDGVRQPIAYASRTLTPCEKKSSSVYELECLAVVFGINKFRRFLEHKVFLLETDNQALSWLLAHPRQLGKIGRWVVQISSLKFTVQHVRGTQNIIADTLSRMYHTPGDQLQDLEPVCGAVLLDCPLAFSDILPHQLNDPELANIICELQGGGAHPPYFLSQGTLCCRARQRGKAQISAAKSSCTDGLSLFPNFSRGRSFSGGERPLEKLFNDYVGAFARSKSGNKFLLVCVDAFSKFVWLFPLRSATAQLTTKVLRTNLFQHFGIPATIVSDNGTQFLSNEFKRMCFGHGIRHVTTSPYYPQPSHAERFNRNLRSALIAFHAKKHETWDQALPWIQFAFNTAVHESHKAVPFELLFGFPPNNPLANIWRIGDLLPPPGTPDVASTWAAARRNLFRARELLRRS
ncbi:uncharacterized protein LOC124363682 [Homalodisca vitripennis]|uniref:uncharacterized protein LOC124363682 n=1 Tax=Homalodisca vitripennis TaxID=197043 RepID=UPI001EEA7F65|nr:uncharacterized protein LOC124363682 [Homalodisca vitripennis]